MLARVFGIKKLLSSQTSDRFRLLTMWREEMMRIFDDLDCLIRLIDGTCIGPRSRWRKPQRSNTNNDRYLSSEDETGC